MLPENPNREEINPFTGRVVNNVPITDQGSNIISENQPLTNTNNSLPPLPPLPIVNNTSEPLLPIDKKKKSKKKIFLLLIPILVIVFLIITFISLIPINNQSTLSRLFDSVGNHTFALGIDSLHFNNSTKGIGASFINADFTKPENCSELWSKISNTQINLNSYSSNNVLYVNTYGNKDLFSGKLFFSSSFDLENASADGNIDLNITSDTNQIRNFLKTSMGSSYQDLGTISLNLILKGVVDTNGSGFKLERLETNSSKMNSLNLSGTLPDWYSTKSNFNSNQIDNIKNVLSDIKKLINVKPSTILSDDTGKYISVLGCKLIKRVEVEKPQLINFGYDAYSNSKYLRPVAIYMQDNYLNTLDNGLDELELKILKDDTFKSFLKGNYDLITDMFEQYSKLTGLKYVKNTRTQYVESIDKSFADALDNLKNKTNSAKSSNTSVTSEPTYLYLTMDDGSIYGTKSSQIIIPDPNSLKDITDSNLKNILSSGIEVKTESYNTSFNTNKTNLQLPSNSKDASNFMEDFSRTSLGTQLLNSISNSYSQVLEKAPTANSNTQRMADITQIEYAIQQYLTVKGHKLSDFGNIPLCTKSKNYIGTGVNYINLKRILVPTYIANIPKDPLFGSDLNTAYTICVSTSGSITIDSPYSENDEKISVTR